MSRYYIHLQDPSGHCHDGEGFEAESLDQATAVARETAGQLLREAVAKGEDAVSLLMCLDDSSGTRIANFAVHGSFATYAQTGVRLG
jgi:hypothetical protein